MSLPGTKLNLIWACRMHCFYLKIAEFPIITDLNSSNLFKIHFIASGYTLDNWLNQFSLEKEIFKESELLHVSFFFVGTYYFPWHTTASQSVLEWQNSYRGVEYCYLILVSFTFWLPNISISLSLLPPSQWQNSVYPEGWVVSCK